ncbi:hypothetical protein BJ508DRAFT_160563 [Ascobolus immersus RN42]|uniref:NACHT domain-containing protein n=1 Tax=Ascobolus immersus RN42 TaxID=1160509 RepID=A0A3N4I207_ASCIM|nr:hypothetical protein BJ508DRAFT_160563 [Ascobolus immersus RN42]
MEPLSIIGLVSNIAQFVEQASTLVLEIKSIYQAGQVLAPKLDEAVRKAKTTQRMIDDIEQSHCLKDGLKKAEALDIGIVDEFRIISQALTLLLDELKLRDGKSKLLESVRVAFKRLQHGNKMDDLLQKLNSLGQEVEGRASELWKKELTVITNHIYAAVQQNEVSLRVMDGTLATSTKQMSVLAEEVRDAVHWLKIAHSLGTSALQSPSSNDHITSMAMVGAGLGSRFGASAQISATDVGRLSSQLVWQSSLLKSLYYEDMQCRKSAIRSTHKGTLAWIQERTDLRHWLEDGDGIFWITGKAGSGKSTLMRFLCQDEQIRTALRKWAGERPLITASHFFWIMGSEIQRSTAGLYRSLLYQLLWLKPDLMVQLHSVKNWVPVVDDWSLEKLETAILELCRAATKFADGDTSSEEFTICIFIDGLDEYSDSMHPTSNIVSIIHSISSLRNVKVCVSSRPWSKFENAYGNNAAVGRIRMHEETFEDMEIYISTHIGWEVASFKALEKEDRLAHRDIVTTIATKAEGVWLWLVLAVRMVVEDLLSDEMTVGEISQRVQLYPSEIYEFIRCIFEERIEARYHEAAARIFLTVAAAQSRERGVPGLVVKFIIEVCQQDEQIHAALHSDNNFSARINQPVKYSILRNQLNNRCKDLLELELPSTECPTVSLPAKDFWSLRLIYLHRCVGDFFKENYLVQLRQAACKSGPFDPKLTIATLSLAVFHGVASSLEVSEGQEGGLEPEVDGGDVILLDWKPLVDFMGIARAMDEELALEINAAELAMSQSNVATASLNSLIHGSINVNEDIYRRFQIYYALVGQMRAFLAGGPASLTPSSFLVAGCYISKELEGFRFAALAIAISLKSYVKELLWSERRILQAYPQLLLSVLRPPCPYNFFGIAVQPGSWKAKLEADSNIFFCAYVTGHPDGSLFKSSYLNVPRRAQGPSWVPGKHTSVVQKSVESELQIPTQVFEPLDKARKALTTLSKPKPKSCSIDVKLLRFLLIVGAIDVNRPLTADHFGCIYHMHCSSAVPCEQTFGQLARTSHTADVLDRYALS